jgi:hypothetical protein
VGAEGIDDSREGGWVALFVISLLRSASLGSSPFDYDVLVLRYVTRLARGV